MSVIKRNKEFGINAITCCCPICGKPVASIIYGDSVEKDLNHSASLLRGVCEDCKEKLEKCDAFVSCDIDDKNQVTKIHRFFFYKHSKLSELFSDTDDIGIINHIPKDNFDKMFGYMLNDYFKEQEEDK